MDSRLIAEALRRAGPAAPKGPPGGFAGCELPPETVRCMLRRAGVPDGWATSPATEGARALGRRVWERCLEDSDAWPGRVCPGLYAVGPAGRGKTWAAYGAACAAILDGRRARVATERALLDEYDADRREGAADAWKRRVAGYDLLCVDDMGKASATDRDLPRLFELVDVRVERGMPTVVTTQFERPELGAWLRQASPKTAEALVSRLVRLRTLRFDGPDLRIPDERERGFE